MALRTRPGALVVFAAVFIVSLAAWPGSASLVTELGLGSGELSHPQGVALAPGGAREGPLYIADAYHQRIAALDLRTGLVTTLAGDGTAGYRDGRADLARFDFPVGVAAAGGYVFVADSNSHRVRAVDLARNYVVTVAGSGLSGFADGNAEDAKFFYPSGLAAVEHAAPADAVDVFVADTANHRVRVVRMRGEEDTVVQTLTGSTTTCGHRDGPPSQAIFCFPRDVAAHWTPDRSDVVLYVADTEGHVVRRTRLSDGVVATVAGDFNGGVATAYRPGAANESRFHTPTGVDVTPGGGVLVVDSAAGEVAELDVETGDVRTIARPMNASSGEPLPLARPWAVVAAPDGEVAFLSDRQHDVIRVLNITTRAEAYLAHFSLEDLPPPGWRPRPPSPPPAPFPPVPSPPPSPPGVSSPPPGGRGETGPSEIGDGGEDSGGVGLWWLWMLLAMVPVAAAVRYGCRKRWFSEHATAPRSRGYRGVGGGGDDDDDGLLLEELTFEEDGPRPSPAQTPVRRTPSKQQQQQQQQQQQRERAPTSPGGVSLQARLDAAAHAGGTADDDAAVAQV